MWLAWITTVIVIFRGKTVGSATAWPHEGDLEEGEWSRQDAGRTGENGEEDERKGTSARIIQLQYQLMSNLKFYFCRSTWFQYQIPSPNYLVADKMSSITKGPHIPKGTRVGSCERGQRTAEQGDLQDGEQASQGERGSGENSAQHHLSDGAVSRASYPCHKGLWFTVLYTKFMPLTGLNSKKSKAWLRELAFV